MKYYFIWGMGLLGASLAIDLKNKGHGVAGCVRSKKNADYLKEQGIADVFTVDDVDGIASALKRSDGVIIGTPVDKIPEILDFLANVQFSNWVTDMASTKAEIMRHAIHREKKLLFVGSHPMAGSDLAGPQNGRPNLFAGATIYITAAKELEEEFGSETYEPAVAEISRFWSDLNANTYMVDYADHDKWAAYLSHGLHLVACMVSHLLEDIPEVFKVPFNPAGGSFRDITRVAGSNPALWDGIIRSNSDEVKNYLQSLQNLVCQWNEKMQNNELDIENIFKDAAEIRNRIIKLNDE